MKKIIIICAFALLCLPPLHSAQGRRSRMPTMQEAQDHATIQQQFLQLQQSVGIVTPQSEINSIRPTSRRQGSQTAFNAIRRELNSLFAVRPIDLNAIQQKIKELENLNPSRWPRTNDYRAVLNKIAGPLPQQVPPQPQQPQQQPLSYEALKEQFQNLQIKFGLQPSSDAKMNQIRSIRGKQGTQGQMNAVRSTLNNLLAKEILNDQDIQMITQQIATLQMLNPARWPQPEDYTELLNLRK